MRPGEKLYEELLIGDNVATTQHDRIMMANESFLPWEKIQDKLDQLETQVRKGNADQIRQTLATVVEGYSDGLASVTARTTTVGCPYAGSGG